MARYIYEYDKWPEFTWDDKKIVVTLGKVRHLQGKIFGQMSALGFSIKEETILSTLTLDVLKSSKIEGEFLNQEQVRSSIAKRLGIDYAGVVHVDRNKEMDVFLNWFNKEINIDSVLKAAIAHFWFIIIYPFDDGNERIARAITDILLARSEGSSQRFYSLSNQILIEKKKYYGILQKVQHSSGDITDWLDWFSNCILRALENTEETLKRVLQKAGFWDKNKETVLNSRQRLMLNKLFDGFDSKLKSSKWAKIAKCSADTALRDIKDLIEKGILKQEESGGRSTNYELKGEWRMH